MIFSLLLDWCCRLMLGPHASTWSTIEVFWNIRFYSFLTTNSYRQQILHQWSSMIFFTLARRAHSPLARFAPRERDHLILKLWFFMINFWRTNFHSVMIGIYLRRRSARSCHLIWWFQLAVIFASVVESDLNEFLRTFHNFSIQLMKTTTSTISEQGIRERLRSRHLLLSKGAGEIFSWNKNINYQFSANQICPWWSASVLMTLDDVLDSRRDLVIFFDVFSYFDVHFDQSEIFNVFCFFEIWIFVRKFCGYSVQRPYQKWE